jgi:hypothetical protein
MNLRWLLMAKRWTQNPPSMGRVKMVAAIVAVCLVLYGIETIWGWPEALTPNGNGRIIR